MPPPKQTPRTKGNLRAANSSRAADLAGASTGTGGGSLPVSSLGGFAQFATPSFSTSSTYVASTVPTNRPSRSGSPATSDYGSSGAGGSDGVSVIMNNELAMILKILMTKRDTTTKVRALEDLESWVKAQSKPLAAAATTTNESSSKDNKNNEINAACLEALGPWVKLYIKLTTDVDRRVRLITNNVHALLVCQVKKGLAPYLKEILGAWVGTFFDPTREVAKTSLESFKSAFPDNKREQVLTFCLKDVLYYISENLLYKTPETLSDPRFASKEEMEARYARVAASSFYTLGYITDNLPTTVLEGSVEFGELLDNTTLWAFFGHSNPLVRRSSYSLLRTLSSKSSGLLKDRTTMISKSFFPKAFADKDLTTLGDMWEALVVFTKAFPESWLIPTDKKPTMTLFFSFLKSAGNGSKAVLTYRNILPLVSNWSDSSVVGKNGTGMPFVKDFFEAFWKGLEHTSIERGQASAGLLLDAYVECLVFFIVRFGKASETTSGQEAVLAAFAALIEEYIVGFKPASVASKLDDDVLVSTRISLHLQVLLNIPSVQQSVRVLVWDRVSGFISTTLSENAGNDRVFVQQGKRTIALLTALAAVAQQKQDEKLRELAFDGAKILVAMTAKQCNDSQSLGASQMLASLATQFETVVFSNSASQKALESFFNDHIVDLLLSPLDSSSVSSNDQEVALVDESLADESLPHLLDLFVAFIGNSSSETINTGAVWSRVVEAILERDIDEGRRMAIMGGIIDRTNQQESVKISLSLTKMDDYAIQVALDKLYTGNAKGEALLVSLLQSTTAIVGDNVKIKVTELLADHLKGFAQAQSGVDHHEMHQEAEAVSLLNILNSTIAITVPLLVNKNEDAVFKKLATAVFDLGLYTEVAISDLVRQALDTLKVLAADHEEISFLLQDSLVDHLCAGLRDITLSASPEDFVKQVRTLADLLSAEDATDRFRLLSLFFFDAEHWKNLKNSSGGGLDGSLAMLSPIVAAMDLSKLAVVGEESKSEQLAVAYDGFALSLYGRLSVFTLELLKREDEETKAFYHLNFSETMNWILGELLRVRQECLDQFAIPSQSIGTFYSMDGEFREANEIVFRAFVKDLRKLVLTWTGFEQDLNWEERALAALSGAKIVDDDDEAGSNLVYFIQKAIQEPNGYNERILAELVSVLVAMEESEVESQRAKAWTAVLRGKTVPLTVLVALIECLKPRLVHTVEFTTLTNYWASELSVAKVQDFVISDASATWRQLVLLTASVSKNPTADTLSQDDGGPTSLPQHRIMNLLQSIRRWGDSLAQFEQPSQLLIQSQLFSLMKALADRVQELPGAHWEMMMEWALKVLTFFEGRVCAETGHQLQGPEMTLIERACSLIGDLVDYAEDEADVMDVWETYQEQILVKAMSLVSREGSTHNTSHNWMDRPRKLYQESLVRLLSGADAKVVLQYGSITDLCGLLTQPLLSLQLLAYEQLSLILKEQTQDLAIQLEIKTTPVSPNLSTEGDDSEKEEKMTKASFPPSLWKIIDRAPEGHPVMDVNVDADMDANVGFLNADADDDDEDHLQNLQNSEDAEAEDEGHQEGIATVEERIMSHKVLGYLLGWKLAFGLFDNTTFNVKAGFVSQIKDDGGSRAMQEFLPFIFHILGVYNFPLTSASSSVQQSTSRRHNRRLSTAPAALEILDLTRWDVTEYQASGFDLSSPELGFPLLCANLYWSGLKHVPSLVRIWWTECKIRPLSIGVESFTERYFSPVLIAKELTSLVAAKEQAGTGNGGSTSTEELSELQIKTSKATSEVTATLQIDECTMEIAIRLPANFPLRQVEVEGIQRVGVKEAQWRSWLFSVAGVIVAQNGSLIDALTLFRKNVGLHFDGVEDCTICYSIVSLQDRSLPNKTCKTCKHRFHASCLYKWFRTSNSSSCPLCRTLW